jgi:hypothetical protein
VRIRIRPNGEHIGGRDQCAATSPNASTRAEAVHAVSPDAAPGRDPGSTIAARPAATVRTRTEKPCQPQDRLDHRRGGGRRGGDRRHGVGSCCHERPSPDK